MRSLSLDSSITFMADSFRVVRPRVSMNVLRKDISDATSGTAVSYLTLLEACQRLSFNDFQNKGELTSRPPAEQP